MCEILQEATECDSFRQALAAIRAGRNGSEADIVSRYRSDAQLQMLGAGLAIRTEKAQRGRLALPPSRLLPPLP